MAAWISGVFSALICCTLVLSGCHRTSASWPGGTGLSLPCDSLPDTDRDGLSDNCELLLARAFAPELRVSARACNWDTSVTPARPGGEYYFGVQPRDTDTVRIVFLPAYYQDCGFSGTRCALQLMNCSGHRGDSEFVVIDVTRDEGQRWRTVGIFLSAHCFGRSTGNCRWFRSDELAQFSWLDQARRAPVIWVAAGKNANYASRAACDRGHWWNDSCADNENSLRYPIASARQNIGSRSRPVGDAQGCVSARHAAWTSARVDVQAHECFWSDSVPFTGWQRRGAGQSTSYARYLRDIAQFH